MGRDPSFDDLDARFQSPRKADGSNANNVHRLDFTKRKSRGKDRPAHSRASSSFGASATFVVLLATLFTGAGLLYLGERTSSPQVPSSAAGTISGRAAVIDGDTLEIRGQRIRLHGIDAPEAEQICRDGEGRAYRCGERAARALGDKVAWQVVSCEARDVDRYHRVVAVCRADGEDVNAWLAAEGWAVAYRQYGWDYVSAEASARRARRGLWSGTFEAPEDWRHREHGDRR